MKNLLIIFILFPVIINSQEQNDSVKYEKDNYSIEYPSNWILNDSGDNGTKIFLYPTNSESSDIFTENINLIIQNLSDASITLEKANFLSFKIPKFFLISHDSIFVKDKDFIGLKCIEEIIPFM